MESNRILNLKFFPKKEYSIYYSISEIYKIQSELDKKIEKCNKRLDHIESQLKKLDIDWEKVESCREEDYINLDKTTT